MLLCAHPAVAVYAQHFLDVAVAVQSRRVIYRRQQTGITKIKCLEQKAKSYSLKMDNHLLFGSIWDLGKVMFSKNKCKVCMRLLSSAQSYTTNSINHPKKPHKLRDDE